MRKPREIKNPDIDRDAPAYRVVMRFGSLARFCAATGFPTSTVYDWLSRGLVPAHHQGRILGVAEELGVDVPREEFVPPARV